MVKRKSPAKSPREKSAEVDARQRKHALDTALGQIEKQYGKGSIMTLGESAGAQVPGISTHSISLDLALGGRGIPRGRITEIYGPESSGKTTVCSHNHRPRAGTGRGVRLHRRGARVSTRPTPRTWA